MTTKLHRHGTHDDPEAHRGNIERGVFGDVGQLRDEYVVSTEAESRQRE